MIQEAAIFGNGARAPSPAMAEVAFNLARSTGNIASAAQQAAQAMLATSVPVDGETDANLSATDLVRPMLAPPHPAATARKELSGAARMTELFGELNALFLSSGQAELEARISQFKEMAKAQQDSAVKASKEFEASLEASTHTVAQRGTAQAAAKHAKQRHKEAEAARSDAEKALEKLQPTLESGPDSIVERENPAYAKARQVLEAKVQLLQIKTTALQQAETALVAANQAAVNSIRHTAALETLALKIGSDAPKSADVLAAIGSSTARLTLLMSELSKLIGKNSEDSMRNDKEMFEAMQVARQAALDKAAADFLVESAKAEHTAKVMGCIGKIVGALLTVVSIIAIPFTGGASAALAVIGIGMMVADKVVEATTGTSLTERIMSPVMEHVIMPMIKLLAKEISKALQSMGLPAEKAKAVAEVMAAIVVAIAVIVVVILLSMVSAAVAAKIVAKMAPALLRSATRTLPGVMRKLTSTSAKKISNVANTAGSVIGTGGAVVTGAGSIAQGVFTKRASDHHAEIVVTTQILQQLQRYLQAAVEDFSGKFKAVNELMALATETSARSVETNRAIISRTRG